MKQIVVIDYGTSNLRSVEKALEHVADKNTSIQISDDSDTILKADKIVFPGQGAVGQCMKQLKQLKLDEAIKLAVEKKPFLGICLGLQSLMEFSDEDGGTDCLSLIKGNVRKFETDAQHKIPHMGWNQVKQTQQHPLWDGIEDMSRFYFVHSYYVCPENQLTISGMCHYITDFTAAIAKENIFACQFHPEKSQNDGLKLLGNFLNW